MNIFQVRKKEGVVTIKASLITEITSCEGDIVVSFEENVKPMRLYINKQEKCNKLYNDLLSAWLLSIDTQAIVIVNLDDYDYVDDWKVGSMTDLFDDLMM